MCSIWYSSKNMPGVRQWKSKSLELVRTIQNGKWLINYEFPFRTSRQRESGTFFSSSVSTGHFQWKAPKSRVPFTSFPTKISGFLLVFLVNIKQPTTRWTSQIHVWLVTENEGNAMNQSEPEAKHVTAVKSGKTLAGQQLIHFEHARAVRNSNHAISVNFLFFS